MKTWQKLAVTAVVILFCGAVWLYLSGNWTKVINLGLDFIQKQIGFTGDTFQIPNA